MPKPATIDRQGFDLLHSQVAQFSKAVHDELLCMNIGDSVARAPHVAEAVERAHRRLLGKIANAENSEAA